MEYPKMLKLMPIVTITFADDVAEVKINWSDSAQEVHDEQFNELSREVLIAASLIADEWIKEQPGTLRFVPRHDWAHYVKEAGE
jgi:hypothetical protein